MAKKEPKHVGTWIMAVMPGGEITKWGKDGDTEYPYTPGRDDRAMLANVIFLSQQTEHQDDAFYILHVFSNGQLKQFSFDLREFDAMADEWPLEVKPGCSPAHFDKSILLDIKYVCPDCGYKWREHWTSACNSECSQCGTRNISPLSYQNILTGVNASLAEEEESEEWLEIKYKCPRCHNEWTEEYDCACDSECECGLKNITALAYRPAGTKKWIKA